MDLDIIILSEVSQTDKRQIPYDIIYMWNLKKMIQPNFFRNRFTDTENKLKLTKGDRWGGCDKLGGWD